MPDKDTDMTKFERKKRLRSVRTKHIKMIAATLMAATNDMSDKQIKLLSRDMRDISLKHLGNC